MARTIEEKIVEGLREFTSDLESGLDISKKYVVRQVHGPNSIPPDARAVVRARKLLRVSQESLASFLGVTVKTIQAWEKGTKRPNRMAMRFLEEILSDPKKSRRRIQERVA